MERGGKPEGRGKEWRRRKVRREGGKGLSGGVSKGKRR